MAEHGQTLAGHTPYALSGVRIVLGYEHQLMHACQMQATGC